MSAWLVLGLGNPGPTYQKTRHNVGFWAIDRLQADYRIEAYKSKFGAEWSKGKINGHEVIIAKPMTFMNRSGEPAQALASFFKVAPAETIVVHDELDFAPGELRVKLGGGAGGHNGLRSLCQTIGPDFVRVRLGVGKPPSSSEGANYVLGVPPAAERALLEASVGRACEAVVAVIEQGISRAMNVMNTAPAKSSAP